MRVLKPRPLTTAFLAMSLVPMACSSAGTPIDAGASGSTNAGTSSGGTTTVGGASTSGSSSSSSTGGSTSSVTSSGTSGSSSGSASTTGALPPPTSVTPQNLAVIVNTSDPQSVAVGARYQQARGIPEQNMFEVSFTAGNSLDSDSFTALKTAIDGDAGANIQAYALTWTFPFIVQDANGCQMSITSAFAFGYDEQWCVPGSSQCGVTQQSPYYYSGSTAPYTDLGIRPAMMLAGTSTQDVYDLIDRGVAADDAFTSGLAYLVISTDSVRSVRAPEFQALAGIWDGGASGLTVEVIDHSQSTVDQGALEDAGDAMFYLVGLATVPGLTSNQYLPGAIGDSLTSFGGILSGAGQTTLLDWLGAGLTASAGTVREPCNFVQKFSNPVVLIPKYTSGETLIEAYWKSVQWPGEVLFAGEPLARPWGR
jgi:uncharacterized protein (TIGR03790 family)